MKKFEQIKKDLLAKFPNNIIRFDKPDYLEIDIDPKDVSNRNVKVEFLSFLKANGLPEIKVDQISPHVKNEKFAVGATFVCNDENHSICEKTCIWIKAEN